MFLYINLFIVVLLLIILSISDIRKRIISNNIVLLLLVAILPLAYMLHQQIFIMPALITLIVGFLLFVLNIIGAGDIKLLTVLMLATPMEQAFSLLFFTALSGLVLIIIGWLFFHQSIRRNGLPYGVAISSGFLINLLLFQII